MASKGGVIVTVEKIVSTDFLRAHAGYVRLPGYRVLAVCEVPFGGHPSGMTSHGIHGVEGYAIDNPFIFTLRQACKQKEALDAWMEEWVLSCPDHSAYVNKLGADRVKSLKDKSRPKAWQDDYESVRRSLKVDEPGNAMERMVVAATREIITRGDKNTTGTLEQELYSGKIRTDQDLKKRAEELIVQLTIRDDKRKVSEQGGILMGEVSETEGGVTRIRRLYATAGEYAIVEIINSETHLKRLGKSGNFVVMGNQITQEIAHACIRHNWKGAAFRMQSGSSYPQWRGHHRPG
jgi:hypothetical protein